MPKRVAPDGAAPPAAQAPPSWRVLLAPAAGAPAARTVRGGMAAGGLSGDRTRINHQLKRVVGLAEKSSEVRSIDLLLCHGAADLL